MQIEIEPVESPVVALRTIPPGGGEDRLPRLFPVLRLRVGDHDDGLLSTAGPIICAAYAVAFVAMATAFWGKPEAMFSVVVSMGYALIYLGTPNILFALRNRADPRWRSVVAEREAPFVAIWTGRIKRIEALAQMTLVPVAVAIGLSFFALIITQVRG